MRRTAQSSPSWATGGLSECPSLDGRPGACHLQPWYGSIAPCLRADLQACRVVCFAPPPRPGSDSSTACFPQSLPEVLDACQNRQEDLEAFLTHIYRAVAGAAPMKASPLQASLACRLFALGC